METTYGLKEYRFYKMSDKKPKSSVSIVTISQYKRFQCLEILSDLITDQTYDNIVEWVIVEGSETQEDADKNKENIANLKSSIPVKYIEYVADSRLGGLRNRANKACSGDIVVCMDDDDYYFPQRVEHAVKGLNSGTKKIAGCSAILLYDFFLKRFYTFDPYGPNHSTNNCMAWKKTFKGVHDEKKWFSEEASFTNNFSEPMVQLDAKNTIIVLSHNQNTYNKREILIGGSLGKIKQLKELATPIHDFIKPSYFQRYMNIFYKEYVNPYDIVYYTGGFGITWSPKSSSLGGSEQAIVHLAERWRAAGKKVAVYAQVSSNMIVNDVDYFDWKQYPFESHIHLLILWRMNGVTCCLPFQPKAKTIWVDLHDAFFPEMKQLYQHMGMTTHKLFFKSEYHKEIYEECVGSKLAPSKYAVIENGVRIEQFNVAPKGIIRQPFRFCYCSCYTRGLLPILKYLWPTIHAIEPTAELHVYYGMGAVQQKEFVYEAKMLLSSPGVMDHGRQPIDMIIREKYLSTFHLYVTNTIAEIDCISIRESLSAGCIPLLSNFGVFKYRDGYHFDLITDDAKCYKQIALKIIKIMRDEEGVNTFREELKRSPLLTTWDDVSQRWLSLI